VEPDLEPVDPVTRLGLDLVVIPDDRLAQHAAKETLAHVPNQVAPFGPVGLGEQREMDVQAPEVQSTREGMVPAVLHAGDGLEREVVESHHDQGADVDERQAVDRE
jgi:hypothetical protein